MTTAAARGDLAALVAERERVLGAFLAAEHRALADACFEMARRLARGGVLVAHGTGAAATDAAHVAVEFVHPVIVGKRALPAVAVGNDPTGRTRPGVLGRSDDVALALAHGPADAATDAFLAEAGRQGMWRLALVGAGGDGPDAERVLTVDSDDADVVQEVQETAYHVLWELVHVFFEHPGLLEESCVTCGDVAVEARVVAVGARGAVVERGGARETVAADLVGPVAPGDLLLCHAGVALEHLGRAPEPEAAPAATGFLYPFLDAEEHDLGTVLEDVAASTLRKGADTTRLRAELDLPAVAACAADVAGRLRAGGRLLAFGNGGSATDAQDLAGDALARGWPALALGNDAATLTGVANDVGFENAFARPVSALGRHGDVAVGISTSGGSANVVAGLEAARRRGMLTVAVVGYGDGPLAGAGWVDHLLVTGGDHVPRIQEVQGTVLHLLLHLIGGRP